MLDDSGNPELKAMAKRVRVRVRGQAEPGLVQEVGQPQVRVRISNGEFILLLDADFAPRADMLDETLPYFDAFPDVGIVQTPQFFRVVDEQTWVERGAGAIQELFYRSIQTARARGDGAICVGSCGVYRRAALAENGGMTLAEHSEDLHTGFDLYRLRLAAALPADRAVHRELPGQHDGLHQPAVPLVLGHDEPAQRRQVLDHQAARCTPGSAIWPA